MRTINQWSLAAALGLVVGLSAGASAQQQTPDPHKNAPAQQTAPAQPAPGMGHGMMREGEHGKMGGQMHQGGSGMSKDSSSTMGASPSTNSHSTPPTGSK